MHQCFLAPACLLACPLRVQGLGIASTIDMAFHQDTQSFMLVYQERLEIDPAYAMDQKLCLLVV